MEGDITEKNIGLSIENLKLLKNEVDEIFHSAAITDLNVPIDVIRQTNVEGTRKILDFAFELKKNHRFIKVNHISTAYVYGNYQGRFTEKDLDVGQNFNTNYEKTKFEAEKLVVKYRKKGMWIDIFRPSMVLGESHGGKTFQMKHIYQVFKLCKLELFDNLPFLNGFVSLVPIDIVSKAIYILSQEGQKKNMTYHTFPRKLNSIDKILNIGNKVLRFKMPKIISLSKFDTNKLTPTQKVILNDLITPLNFRIKLSSKATNSILGHLKFKIPEVNKVIIKRMLEYSLKRTQNGYLKLN
jgi:thioester reductase-like protein